MVVGGHSPVLNWGLGMWSEPVPLVLDHVPLQEKPRPTQATSVGYQGGSPVFLLLYSSCCP